MESTRHLDALHACLEGVTSTSTEELRQSLHEERRCIQWALETAEALYGPLPEPVRTAVVEDVGGVGQERLTRLEWLRLVRAHPQAMDGLLDEIEQLYEAYGLLEDHS